MPVPEKLPPEKLVARCDPSRFTFESTAELDGENEIAGQERALGAIEFSVGIRHDGFNLFALGPSGVGKQSAVTHYLGRIAPEAPVPDDWCYVYNFDQARKPKTLRLPQGKACSLQKDMDLLIETMFSVLPAAFSSEEYQAREKEIHESFQEQQNSAIEELEKSAQKHDIALIRTPAGFAFAPVRKGEVIKSDAYLRLRKNDRESIEQQIVRLREELQTIMTQIPRWHRETVEKITGLNRDVASYTVKPVIADLRKKYGDLDNVLRHLDAVEKDLIENFDHFIEKEQSPEEAMSSMIARNPFQKGRVMTRYKVNIIIDNSRTSGAPVIFEEKPTFQNLVGDIEHIAQMGTLITDFTLIKAGALHRANGGFLVLDARRVLMEPFAWEALKKAVRTQQLQIESLSRQFSMISTVSLEPEPIPLDVRVILLGERNLYYLLSAYDPDFGELFKVAADFEEVMERNDENSLAYARLIGSMASGNGHRPFDRGGVARVVEYGSRLAGDASKLSTHLQSICDLVHESDYHASKAGRLVVTGQDVQDVLDARTSRASRIQERLREAMLRNMIIINTDSELVGQINGLSVYSLGEQSFGRPSRITARVRLGKGEVTDIEREVAMGGPIHSKGVLILSGFLGARFASDKPLTLAATLVFEQSYGQVEGDSASSAELYALLSAISGIPIRQWFAVTGSVNQYGEVQAIGGVNEKIEGFFDLCRDRGLDGRHGVLIPVANVQNLMLRNDVVKAVEDGLFSIYPISHIDEGIEILTGIPAGTPDVRGDYPPDTVNGRTSEKLRQMAETLKAFANGRKDNG